MMILMRIQKDGFKKSFLMFYSFCDDFSDDPKEIS